MGALELPLRGTIPCPNCEKTIAFVYEDTKGHSSIRCFHCGKTVMIDYIRLRAHIIPPVRRFNKKSIPSK